jgi:hypothetical protein
MDHAMVARQKPTQDDSLNDPPVRATPVRNVGRSSQSIPVWLRSYLAPDVSPDEVSTILADVPDGVNMLESWVRRFQDDPSVKRVAIEIDPVPGEPIVVPTLDTVLEGEPYLSFEHAVWEWWDETFPTAPREIRIAVW